MLAIVAFEADDADGPPQREHGRGDTRGYERGGKSKAAARAAAAAALQRVTLWERLAALRYITAVLSHGAVGGGDGDPGSLPGEMTRSLVAVASCADERLQARSHAVVFGFSSTPACPAGGVSGRSV